SERHVLMHLDIFPDSLAEKDYPAFLAKQNIDYAIFPPTLYHKGERVIRDMMEHGVIVPVQRIEKTQEMVLARVKIIVPPGDWHDAPTVDVMTTRGMRTMATATTPATIRPKIQPTTAQAHRA